MFYNVFDTRHDRGIGRFKNLLDTRDKREISEEVVFAGIMSIALEATVPSPPNIFIFIQNYRRITINN